MSENIVMQEVVTKPKKSKKKLLIILASIVAVLGIAAAILLSCFGQYQGQMYKDKEEVYAYFGEKPHDSLCYDLSKYDKKLSKIDAEYSIPDVELDESVKKAQPLPEELNGILQEGNQILIDFFAEEYGISVAEEMAELKVVYGALANFSGGGIYYTEDEGVTDGNVVALDICFIEDYEDLSEYTEEELVNWKSRLYATYLHEAIHYLGSAYLGTESLYIPLIEGITEALTEEAMTSADYAYTNDSTYILNTGLAKQLLVADKDIVVLLIDGFDYVDPDELEAYLDDKSFDGMGEAIGQSISLMMDAPQTKKYQRMAQHLMGEYLKYYNLTEEQMIEIADSFIAPISKFSK